MNAPSKTPHRGTPATEEATRLPSISPHQRLDTLAAGAMGLWAAELYTADAPAWGWAVWLTCCCVAAATVRAAR
jgi:hypothetical protein